MVSQSGKRKNKRNKPASQTDAASIKKTSKSEIFSQTFGFAGLFRSGSCYLTIYSVDCSALNAFGTTF